MHSETGAWLELAANSWEATAISGDKHAYEATSYENFIYPAPLLCMSFIQLHPHPCVLRWTPPSTSASTASHKVRCGLLCAGAWDKAAQDYSTLAQLCSAPDADPAARTKFPAFLRRAAEAFAKAGQLEASRQAWQQLLEMTPEGRVGWGCHAELNSCFGLLWGVARALTPLSVLCSS